MSKTVVFICMSVGSLIGGYLPVLFGVSAFSFTSVITSAVGGIIGVFVGLRLGDY